MQDSIAMTPVGKNAKTCYVFANSIAQALSWISDESGDIHFDIPLIQRHLPATFKGSAVLLLSGWHNSEDYTEPFKKRVKALMEELNGSV